MLAPKIDFTRFKESQKFAADNFAQKEVQLIKISSYVNPYMEGGKPPTLPDITLKCLPNYNYMRTWPITQETESGEIDRQSVQLYFHRDELIAKGLLTNDGLFPDYQPDTSKIRMDGLLYEPFGDTWTAFTGNEDLWFSIIVKRYITDTGTNR